MIDILSAAPDGTALNDSPSENEVDTVLDYLLVHKKEFIQEFLRERQLPFSGTVQKLRERLTTYLTENKVKLSELIELLDKIEGWGNQHIYLYKAPDWLLEQWVQESFVTQHLRDAGVIDLLNQLRPVLLPDEVTLSAIQWSPQQFRLVWVEARKWEERVPDRDLQEGNLVWRAYKINVSRGVMVFEWNLVTGIAMLMINNLRIGSDYRAIHDRVRAKLASILSLGQFNPILVSRAIQQIEMSREVRRRRLAYESRGGGKVQFTSARSSEDLYNDTAIHNAAVIFYGKAAGIDGNFYWLPAQELSRVLHCHIYGDDQRIGIFGQHWERDVRYVLSSILRYCGSIP